MNTCGSIFGCRFFQIVVALAISLFGLSPSHADDDNWMRFLGVGGAASVEKADLPTNWNANSNVKWKTEMPGPGASSPIVLNDRIFLTCYTGYGVETGGKIEDLQRHLLCIDRRTGNIIWKNSVDNTLVKNEDPYESFITHHGYATNTPVTDGRAIYAFFGKAGLFAFDLQGNELWKRQFESTTNKTRWGSAASPILHGDNLIVNAIDECGKIYAISRNDGTVAWEFDAQTRMAYSTPNLIETKSGQTELIVAVPEKVIGLDPENGKQKWFANTTLIDEVNASVMVHGDVAWIYGGYKGVGSLAVRAGGTGDVTESHVIWSTRDTSYVATPVLNDGHIFWINEKGIAFCVEAETGKRVFQKRVPGVEGGRGVKFFASMLSVGDNIYAVSRSSGTFILSASPEFNIVGQNVIGSDDSEFNATPAVSGDEMFIRSNKYLYCISK